MIIVINLQVHVFAFYSDLDVLNDYILSLTGGWPELLQCYHPRAAAEDIRPVLRVQTYS